MSTWSDMSAAQRNHWLGELIGAAPQSQCYLAVDGKPVLATPYAEKDRMRVDAALALLKNSDEAWAEFRAANSQSADEWRAKLEVHIERWHLRYSDTPAGAWDLVNWLIEEYAAGVVTVQVQVEGVVVSFGKGSKPALVTAGATTLPEAVCDCVLQLKAPEMLTTTAE